jgi:hypothetical protein
LILESERKLNQAGEESDTSESLSEVPRPRISLKKETQIKPKIPSREDPFYDKYVRYQRPIIS